MNAVTTIPPEEEGRLIEVLGNSLYPGASPDSIRLVLAWCRVTGRDPMRRPVHLVPMSVKVSKDKYEWRDVIMPGIGTYRTDASRTGQYAGKTEPEFGPTITETIGNAEVSYPQWCRVTVKRLVDGRVCDFTAKELWIENYATAGRNDVTPNTMWRKRAYGQLAKCAEAQALRMGFPEETGNTNTAEEMEGKTFDGVTIDAKPEAPQKAIQQAAPVAYPSQETPAPPPPKQTFSQFLTALKIELDACEGEDDYNVLLTREDVVKIVAIMPAAKKKEYEDMTVDALDRITGVDTTGRMEQ